MFRGRWCRADNRRGSCLIGSVAAVCAERGHDVLVVLQVIFSSPKFSE